MLNVVEQAQNKITLKLTKNRQILGKMRLFSLICIGMIQQNIIKQTPPEIKF
jgi:hypothetical protein